MPSRREMSLAILRYDRTLPLLNGTVKIPDVFVMETPSRISAEGLVSGLFDAAEMPLARYLFMRERGDPITALPIFPLRIFPHQYMFTREDAGITSPSDLRGKNVMIHAYFITPSIWYRGIMKEDYGILPTEVTWHHFWPDRDGRMRVPEGVTTAYTPSENFGVDRLLDGSVDCLMLDTTPTVPDSDRHKVVRVFKDVGGVQKDWYRRTGYNVAIHVIAVRQAAVDERPALTEELCAAFDEAKSIAYLQMQNEWATGLPLMRTYLDETRELFGDDPWPYGLVQNWGQIDKLLHYSNDQGFLGRRLSPEEIFEQQAAKYEFTSRMPHGSRPGSPQIG